MPMRIVSLSQPWVRPIVPGKAHANTEFGAKVHATVEDDEARARRQSIQEPHEPFPVQRAWDRNIGPEARKTSEERRAHKEQRQTRGMLTPAPETSWKAFFGTTKTA